MDEGEIIKMGLRLNYVRKRQKKRRKSDFHLFRGSIRGENGKNFGSIIGKNGKDLWIIREADLERVFGSAKLRI